MIDLRSDTVTKPSRAMLETMVKADLGDDVYGEDPTINALESKIAEIVGMEDAVFAASGTQTNLIALLTHCQRGDEYIVGQLAHTYKYEGGGAAVLGSIQPQPLDFEKNGTLDLDKIKQFIKPDDIHFARTKLLCLENTTSGLALPMDYLRSVRQFAKENNLNLHLDGARLFNATIKHSIKPDKITEYFDTVSVCFSKGLGAPVGSALCGSKEQVKQARKWRKMLGGGMRQAGMLAKACIYALQNNVERLAQDHENAQFLAQGLSNIDQLNVDYNSSQTNMVYISLKEQCLDLQDFMKNKGVLILPGKELRLVCHLNISKGNIILAIEAFKDYFKN